MFSLFQVIITSVITFYFGYFSARFLYLERNLKQQVSLAKTLLKCPDISCTKKQERPTTTCPDVKCPTLKHSGETKCPDCLGNASVPFHGRERRCIAFTLYPMKGVLSITHSGGLLHQIRLAKVLYPKWKIKLYLSTDLKNTPFLNKLLTVSFNESIIVDIIWKSNKETGHYGHFWRFLVADDTDCDRWIVRDVDCRFTIREMQAVHDWINSGKSFHIMRDLPVHDGEILAGLFGGTSRSLKGKKMSELIEEFLLEAKNKETTKAGFWSDQVFLAKKVFPIIKKDFVAHDDWPQHGNCIAHGNCVAFPVKDLPFVSHWTHLETVLCSCQPRCICERDNKCPNKKVAYKYDSICMEN